MRSATARLSRGGGSAAWRARRRSPVAAAVAVRFAAQDVAVGQGERGHESSPSLDYRFTAHDGSARCRQPREPESVQMAAPGLRMPSGSSACLVLRLSFMAAAAAYESGL